MSQGRGIKEPPAGTFNQKSWPNPLQLAAGDCIWLAPCVVFTILLYGVAE